MLMEQKWDWKAFSRFSTRHLSDGLHLCQAGEAPVRSRDDVGEGDERPKEEDEIHGSFFW